MRSVVIPSLLSVALLATACSPGRTPEASHEVVSFPAVPDKLVSVELAACDVEARVGEVDRIEIEVDLEVRASSRAAGQRWLERHKPEIEDSEKTLHVRSPRGRTALYLASFHQTRANVRVTLPPRCRLEVATTSGDVGLSGTAWLADPVRITTSSGDVLIEGGAHYLIVHTSSGDCRVSGPPLELMEFESSSGSLRLRSGAHRVSCETSSGDVTLESLTGSLAVHSSSGETRATWERLAPESSVRIETTSGDVSLNVPSHARLRGELASSSGRVRCELDGMTSHHRHKLELKTADPATATNVVTTSGDIAVHVTPATTSDTDGPKPLASPAPLVQHASPEAPAEGAQGN